MGESFDINQKNLDLPDCFNEEIFNLAQLNISP
jgi:hypothetical protein